MVNTNEDTDLIRPGGPACDSSPYAAFYNMPAYSFLQREREPMTQLSKQQRTEFEAAAFRTLVAHLRNRTDVQNIDLMNLGGFCRNCLSNWYQDAANAAGVELDKSQAREIIYGMPYETWKEKHQSEATDEQKAALAASHKDH